MIQESAQSHYLGVLCSRCKARTPISNKSGMRYEELKKLEVSQTDDDGEPRAFTLRCKACDAEGVYDARAIQEFEGAPRKRASPVTNQTLRKRRTRSVNALKQETS